MRSSPAELPGGPGLAQVRDGDDTVNWKTSASGHDEGSSERPHSTLARGSRWYISCVDPEPKEFKNVTIYTPADIVWPNIVRIDATKAKIWIRPDAQHKKSVNVEFTRQGKRKTETTVSSGKPYVVVVSTTHAIQPDDLYLPPVGGVSSTRYGVENGF
jgi:hypothetical protein